MTTATKELTNSDDVIDVRDVIARVEELEGERENACKGRTDGEDSDLLAEFDESDEGQEYGQLKSLLEDLAGNGGDEDWRGDWYPLTLVRDDYFQTFAQEEAESLDLVKSDARWPYTCIDWEQAAEELKVDYATVDFDGVTYWYR
jgi:hypothetical protein